MRTRPIVVAITLVLAASPAQAKTDEAAVASALSSPGRPDADMARDADRKPAALLAFAGIHAGDTVADLLPGGGYFTRLFGRVTGPEGRVFAWLPNEILQLRPAMADGVKAIAGSGAFGRVEVVSSPTAAMTFAAPIDLAWTSQNYHDIYGRYGPQAAAAWDAAIFRALKPGGVFIVIDHVAKAGSGDVAPKTLHRIDPALVKAQVVAAGFVLEAESDVLRNPDDSHDLPVFDPALRGHTDQFVLKFRKPAK